MSEVTKPAAVAPVKKPAAKKPAAKKPVAHATSKKKPAAKKRSHHAPAKKEGWFMRNLRKAARFALTPVALVVEGAAVGAGAYHVARKTGYIGGAGSRANMISPR
jgi:hypothetical protein